MDVAGEMVLAIPHVIVLVFLRFAFLVTTIVAGIAILFTGRYPRQGNKLVRRRCRRRTPGSKAFRALYLVRLPCLGPLAVPSRLPWTRSSSSWTHVAP